MRAHQKLELLSFLYSDGIRRDITMSNIPFLLWVLLLVDGVSTEESLSKNEGESVTLKPGEIKEDDIIQWWFDGQIIADMVKGAKPPKTLPGPENIFKGRLNLDNQTGSLTITNIVAKHGGVYKLQIKGDTETSKIFRVTVHESGLSPGAVAGIVVGVLLLLLVSAAGGGGIYYHKKNSELRSSIDGAETKESNKPLNSGTVNGEGL